MFNNAHQNNVYSVSELEFSEKLGWCENTSYSGLIRSMKFKLNQCNNSAFWQGHFYCSWIIYIYKSLYSECFWKLVQGSNWWDFMFCLITNVLKNIKPNNEMISLSNLCAYPKPVLQYVWSLLRKCGSFSTWNSLQQSEYLHLFK